MSTAYISEASYAGTPPTDFVEIAVDSGIDTSGWSVMLYQSSGNWLVTYPFTPAVTTISGRDVYVFNITLNEVTAVAIVDDTGAAVQFLSFYDPPVTSVDGPLVGQTPSYAGVTAPEGSSIQSDDGGASYYVQPAQNAGTIPCFAAGTRILTPDGARPVETLAAGDLVTTVEGAVRPIAWVQRRLVGFRETPDAPRPVLIAAHALGPGRPESDLVVSAQHRIVMGGFGQGVPLFTAPVLVPAASLTGLPGVRGMHERRRIEWVHLLFRRHELLVAQGCVAESLFLGPMVVGSVPAWARAHLRATADAGQPVGRDGPIMQPALPLVPVSWARREIDSRRAVIGACSSG